MSEELGAPNEVSILFMSYTVSWNLENTKKRRTKKKKKETDMIALEKELLELSNV
ncbi:hypothetical protein J6590_030965 [Homalodisca vitripennis]|nr:hypothetical protein J6590_030965 [Homalodisca vitripennis]